MIRRVSTARIFGKKIAGFGLSKRLLHPSTLTTCCGTDLYIAPEVRRQLDDGDVEPYTAAADVWSLGVILHYMLLGRHPSCSRADYTGRSTSTQRAHCLSLLPILWSAPLRVAEGFSLLLLSFSFRLTLCFFLFAPLPCWTVQASRPSATRPKL
jgi:serine/threonine protein kinase